MRNHRTYKHYKRLNLTAKKINALTIAEVHKVGEKVTASWIDTMKRCLLLDIRIAKNNADETEIKRVLDDGFPEWDKTRKGKEILGNAE